MLILSTNQFVDVVVGQTSWPGKCVAGAESTAAALQKDEQHNYNPCRRTVGEEKFDTLREVVILCRC